jgi:aspartyl/asparaginyl beta-hydroxylase (cupin superfamily)
MKQPDAQPQPTYIYHGGRFVGNEPFFYEPSDFPWVKQLEENWLAIRREIEALLEQHQDRLKPYFNRTMAFPPDRWKTLGFYYWNYRLHKNCRACPQTVRLLESIPNMTAGSLSVLEPGTNINPHQGDTNAIIRVHLGLSIPAPLPDCGMQVGTDIREWKEGKALLFCDAHAHLAWNSTKERRLVLIVDVMRPQFAAQTAAICSHVLAFLFLQTLYQRHAYLNRLPLRLKHLTHFLLRNMVRAMLPFQRRMAFLSGLSEAFINPRRAPR